MSTLSAAKQVNASELSNWLKKEKQKTIQNDITIVDVRERHEIEKHGKIKGAVNIVFQCMSGRRSDEAAILAQKHGFEDTYSLTGGLKAWDGPIQPFMDNHSPWVHTIFDTETETAQYVVTDLETKEAYIIDPVLDYDSFSSTVHPLTAKSLIQFTEKYELNVSKIIDTHVHADHLTAAHYLKSKLPSKPKFLIGENVTKVQKVFRERYNLDESELKTTGEQFDTLIKENMTWMLGNNIKCSVLPTPGHTPACMSIRIGDAAFVGDTLFMPDIGTARCDFPGGSAKELYQSIHKMYKYWPDDTRIYVGHDYPPADRSYNVMTSLENQKTKNKMINTNISLQDYIKMRTERDSKLKTPRYIHPSIQTNLRGGILPTPENDKKPSQFFKIPVRFAS
ncbi:hypothetical protein INT48_007537 [Thamnidium elegans]|uniref:Rhodanese domain-containing protein n=1 Tax=Thamnidium elegans TaxID=101142 RepID=A0A8H7SJ84_9FUNG|nr:hypothetical protein INT48_007537 [Thamnidium elegans]